VATETYFGGRILIVDDDPTNVLLLERMLSRAGYRFVTSTTDSRQALPLFRETGSDLVLLDLMMPYLDGFAVMEQLAAEVPEGDYVPVLVLTADATPSALRRALSAGARDFLTKPFDQTELLLRVKNLLETRFLHLGLLYQVRSLEQLNEQAQRALSRRDESLTEIAHDLGQPLAALRLTADSLKEEIDSGATEGGSLASDVQMIDAATGQISAMLSELSDLARLQMGRDLVLQRRRTDLVTLVRDAVRDQKRSAKRHQFRVETSARAIEGEWDPVRLRRVLSNLLNNAIKYSPAGGDLVLQLSLVPIDGSRLAQIQVSDQGIGIHPDDLPHVFDRFFRGRNVTPEAAGSGVGLAGVKQIIEQHGGSISMESEEGRGTTVTVLLPAN
jgi:signal transduction histidine kinase